jgi:hypothetical protein
MTDNEFDVLLMSSGGRELIGIYKNAQCMTFVRQIVETLIFQREFEENVAGCQPCDQSKEADRGSENACRDQRRHQSEPAHSYPEHHQQRTCPLNQEELNPRVANFVIQQHVNSFWDRDQITERAILVSEDKHFVRHKIVDLEGFSDSALLIITVFTIISVTSYIVLLKSERCKA